MVPRQASEDFELDPHQQRAVKGTHQNHSSIWNLIVNEDVFGLRRLLSQNGLAFTGQAWPLA